VTVGSPLGIKSIRRQLETPLDSPPGVANWFKAYDDRDLVALVPVDQRTFDVTPGIDNWNGVRNFTDNRHGIGGYLWDPLAAGKLVYLQGAIRGRESPGRENS
jgi:hypothetical protein